MTDIPPSYPGSPVNDSGSLSSTGMRQGFRAEDMPTDRDTTPLEDPPEYKIAASRPVEPVVYSFSPLSATSMLLVPPDTAPDRQPRYHISVSTNCFTPTSHITTIRRGGSETGQYVGDFEMGLTSDEKPGTICIQGKEILIRDMFNDSKRLGNYIVVKLPEMPLFWDDSPGPKKCYSSTYSSTAMNDKYLVAELVVPNQLRQPGSPAQLTQIKIYPQGYERFDDIVISALVIERKRTTLAVARSAIERKSTVASPSGHRPRNYGAADPDMSRFQPR